MREYLVRVETVNLYASAVGDCQQGDCPQAHNPLAGRCGSFMEVIEAGAMEMFRDCVKKPEVARKGARDAKKIRKG